MKVAHILSSISRANGGISESVRRLTQSLAARGESISVHSLLDAHTASDLPAWHPVAPSCHAVRGPRAIGYAPGLAASIRAADADVSHVSGLWMYTSVANRTWARRTGRPYVVSPHGMLDGWALRNSRWKKVLAAAAFERAHLEGAACLHALCQAEADAIRAYGLRNPIAVIPNGIDMPQPLPADTKPAWAGKVPDQRRILLFLGRIHPKKGLDPLLRAWARVRPADWQLVIAGWDQGGHQRDLESYVAAEKLDGSVLFTGPLHGPAKAAAYAHADAFVLPSFSEGLPMTVLEAWAHAVPVLMTSACNLPEGFSAGAAVRIDAESETLSQQLATFMALPEGDRAAVGAKGRALAIEHFDWTQLAGRWQSLYAWVAGVGKKPDWMR